MSPDLVVGLIFVAVVGGVLLISLGFARGEHGPRRPQSGGSEAVFLAVNVAGSDGGAHCSPGDSGGGGSCDGGGGGS